MPNLDKRGALRGDVGHRCKTDGTSGCANPGGARIVCLGSPKKIAPVWALQEHCAAPYVAHLQKETKYLIIATGKFAWTTAVGTPSARSAQNHENRRRIPATLNLRPTGNENLGL